MMYMSLVCILQVFTQLNGVSLVLCGAGIVGKTAIFVSSKSVCMSYVAPYLIPTSTATILTVYENPENKE